MKHNKLTYRQTGIDTNKIQKTQLSLANIISATHSFSTLGKVISGFGHYAGLIELDSEILALHTDGVGTKIIVAQMMNRYDSIGVDCVAMNVNDVICVGARPIGFLDYIALRSPNSSLLRKIGMGLANGARQSDIPIVGGETAIVPDLLTKDDRGKAFDLAGMIVGVVSDRSRLVLGTQIKNGDVILGIESSGLHSNGYTLARRVLFSKYSIHDTTENLKRTIGEEMLTPTRIYVKPILEILKNKKRLHVHGLAHITGGAFTKLTRLNKKVNFRLDSLALPPTGIFKQIQLDGGIEMKEMYRTFNMGIGFCIILPKPSVDEVISIVEKHKMQCRTIGVVDGTRMGSGKVIVKVGNRNHIL